MEIAKTDSVRPEKVSSRGPDILQRFTRGLWMDGLVPTTSDDVDLRKRLRALRKEVDTHLDGLEDEIAGPDSSPLERLLAERIVTIHAALLYEDHRLALCSPENHDAAALLHDRVQRIERRYLAAIKALADVRRMLRPSLQVNVAEQQVVL